MNCNTLDLNLTLAGLVSAQHYLDAAIKNNEKATSAEMAYYIRHAAEHAAKAAGWLKELHEQLAKTAERTAYAASLVASNVGKPVTR